MIAALDARPSPEQDHERGPEPMTHVVPYFSLTRGCWILAAFTWDAATGALRRLEGPEGFTAYRQAVEASRFLARAAAPEGRMKQDTNEEGRR